MKPILCNYYLTYRCNCKCQFCDIWQHPKYQQIKDADLNRVFENLKSLKRIGVRFVDFTGGEPLLYPHLVNVLKFARELGFRTSVTTNCLLYEKYARELKGLITYLHFSLDSLNEKSHNSIRGIASFQSVMRSIELAKGLGEQPDILFTVTESNYREILPLQKFCAENKIVLIVNPVFGYGKQRALENSILDYLDQFRAQPFVYINRAFHQLRRNGGNQKNKPRCRAMSSSIVISPDNKILAPCFHFQTEEFAINGNLEKIFHSMRYLKLKANEGKFNFCQGCAINCYLDPSFTYKVDQYFWLSLISKTKYIFNKHFRTRLGRKR